MSLIELVGFSLDTAGKLLIAASVFLVHKRVMKEQKINEIVLAEMKKERNLALLGIVLIAAGYFLQLPAKI